jgi:prefoldin subunit 5
MMDMFGAMLVGAGLGVAAGIIVCWGTIKDLDKQIDAVKKRCHQAEKRAQNLAEELQSARHQIEHLQGCSILAIKTLNAPQDAT